MTHPWTDHPAPDITAAITAAEARLAQHAGQAVEPIYIGFRGLDGSYRVFVARGNGAITPLPCYGYHAESFAWGTRNPEAAELAFAILLDLLHDWPSAKQLYLHGNPALDTHMRFLREVVSQWPAGSDWWYTTTEAAAWYAAHSDPAPQAPAARPDVDVQ